MRKVTALLLCLGIFATLFLCAGCAGRNPNPIPMHIEGDSKLNCEALQLQKEQCMEEMARLEPKCNKFVSNTFWFVVFPFLMDCKDAEKVEYDAYQRRINYIDSLLLSNGCVAISDSQPIK